MGYLTPQQQCHALGAPGRDTESLDGACPPRTLLWGVQSILQYHPSPDNVLLLSHSFDITGEIRVRKLNRAYFCDMISPHNTQLPKHISGQAPVELLMLFFGQDFGVCDASCHSFSLTGPFCSALFLLVYFYW